VLLVRRFDRAKGGDGYKRFRMVSALTLLRSDDDVTSRRQWSYTLLADEIRRISAKPREDLRELFARMCFNAATSNLDDHPRNHAVIASGRDWRLSPAYDLNPSPVISRERRELAMTCGQMGRFANRQNLLSEAGRFLLEADEAASLFDDIINGVRKKWNGTMRRAGVTAADRETIARAFLYHGLFYPAPR
jgi:serine/threonine-protein kinase HipA